MSPLPTCIIWFIGLGTLHSYISPYILLYQYYSPLWYCYVVDLCLLSTPLYYLLHWSYLMVFIHISYHIYYCINIILPYEIAMWLFDVSSLLHCILWFIVHLALIDDVHTYPLLITVSILHSPPICCDWLLSPHLHIIWFSLWLFDIVHAYPLTYHCINITLPSYLFLCGWLRSLPFLMVFIHISIYEYYSPILCIVIILLDAVFLSFFQYFLEVCSRFWFYTPSLCYHHTHTLRFFC